MICSGMEEGEKEEKTVLRHGWLTKSPRQGKKIKRWKTRYFVFCEITSGTKRWLQLFYYKDLVAYKARKMPENCIDISEASDIGIGKEEIDGHKHIINIQVPGRLYHLSASSCDEMFDWSLILRAHKFNDMSMLKSPDKWYPPRSDYEIIRSNYRLKEKYLYCLQCAEAIKKYNIFPDNLYVNMPVGRPDDSNYLRAQSNTSDPEPTYLEIDDGVHHPHPSENTIHDYVNIAGYTWNRDLSRERTACSVPLESLFKTDLSSAQPVDLAKEIVESQILENNNLIDNGKNPASRFWQKTEKRNDNYMEESGSDLKLKRTTSAPCLALEQLLLAPRANSVSSANVSRYKIDFSFPKKSRETIKNVQSALSSDRRPVQETEEKHDSCEPAMPSATGTTEYQNRATTILDGNVTPRRTLTRREPIEHSQGYTLSGDDSTRGHTNYQPTTFLITRV